MRWVGLVREPRAVANKDRAKLTRDNYGVRLFRPNNVLCLNWRSNHLHRAGHDSSFATNPFGEVRLVTGTDWNFRVRHIAAGRTVDEIDELWLWFVALLIRPGCLTHLIVLRFADAFLEHLRTLAASLGIFIFSKGVCCLPSRRPRHGIPTLGCGDGFTTLFLRIHFRFPCQLTFGLLIVSLGRLGRRTTVNRG
jgi:hypothetical protein